MSLAEQAELIARLRLKDEMSPGFVKAQGAFARMTGDFKNAAATGLGFGTGFGTFYLMSKAISGVVDTIGDAIGAASDLNETQSKLDQVFLTNADVIRGWAMSSAKSMGLSKQAALEAAGTFGNFLQAMGSAEDESALMSVALVQLASDLASFNNASPADALVALRAGLAGETEPLRRLGVDIQEVTVKAELMRQGIVAVNGEYTMAEKIQGRYALIMRQTSKAQGDYARTASETANATRTLNAELENAKAALGATFLPIVRGAVSALAELFGTTATGNPQLAAMVTNLRAVADASKEVAEGGGALRDEWRDALILFNDVGKGNIFGSLIDAGGALSDQLGPQIVEFREWAFSVEEAAKAAGLSAQDMMDLAQATKEAGGGFPEFQANVSKLITEIAATRQPIKEITKGLSQNIPFAMGDTSVAMAKLATDAAAFKARFRAALGTLAGITEGTLDDAKTEAQLGMADIVWALKHPMAEADLADFYRSQIQAGNKAMLRAQANGNRLAYAKASEFVADMKAKLSELSGADLTINTSIRFPAHGGNKHGARGSGGHTEAYGAYTVGEHGRETLVMGDRPGYVVPHGGARGAGGTTALRVMVTLSAREIIDATQRVSFGNRAVAS